MNELYHYGIKDQKWYVRRFQNKDGSLTPLGRKRYNQKSDDYSKELSDVISRFTSVNELTRSKVINDMYNDKRLNSVKKELDNAHKLGKQFSNLSKEQIIKYKLKAYKSMVNDGDIDLNDSSDVMYLLYEDWDQGPNSSFGTYLKEHGTNSIAYSSKVLAADRKYRKVCEEVVNDRLGQYGDKFVTYGNKYRPKTVKDVTIEALYDYQYYARWDTYGESKKYMLEE